MYITRLLCINIKNYYVDIVDISAMYRNKVQKFKIFPYVKSSDLIMKDFNYGYKIS